MGDHERDLQVLREAEAVVERILNHKGRVQLRVEKREPWWFRMVWTVSSALVGGAIATLGWVWTGKAALETHIGNYNAAIRQRDMSYSYFSNSVSSLAGDMVSRSQLRIYSDRLERFNTNLIVPDVDSIRTFYPYTLPQR